MHNIINDKSLVLGIMSGTSMDGLDISCSRYYKKNNNWDFDLIASKTMYFDDLWKEKFLNTFNGKNCIDDMDIQFGNFISKSIQEFINFFNLKIDLISSHGHTIFHNPSIGYTKQIGSGSVIANTLRVPVVSNFRQQDIDLGGQGAPLVPIGDKLLFSQYDACINLGGIANISFDYKEARIAFDISPCNMLLNYVSEREGVLFDRDGIMAENGKVDQTFLTKLNNINYYQLSFPKSLAKEYIDQIFLPIINNTLISNYDILCTLVEHIAIKISSLLSKYNLSNAFFTGGGALNSYLIGRIKQLSSTKIIIPEMDVINFKEAIIFGFLGVLRINNQVNCLSSSTGARMNHSSGDIHLL